MQLTDAWKCPRVRTPLPMIATKKSRTVVGLDIEAGSIAATEVQQNGRPEVVSTAVAGLAPGVFQEGEVVDAEALGEALGAMFSQHGLGKRVRLGVANQRVAVRTLTLPAIDAPGELETAVRFQAQDQIPMPLDQAVLDYHVTGEEQGEDGNRRKVVVTAAARRDMVGKFLEATRKGGLRPVGIDLAAFGMIRALAGPDPNAEDAPPAPRLYCNLGDVTNLAVARGRTCTFTRVSTWGVEGMAQGLAERRKLTLEHARQWLVHIGLDRPTEEVGGEEKIVAAGREVLEEGAAKLTDELRLSLEYFDAQGPSEPVASVVVCGPGATVPGLPERLQAELGIPLESGRAAAVSHLDGAIASRLTVSYGLATES
jgi:type IV pilus assembly protein PilM